MAELTVMKIQCKDGDKLYVAIRGSEVVLAREDPNDKTQVRTQPMDHLACLANEE